MTQALDDVIKDVQQRLNEVQTKVASYSLGDRPPSPPVALLREEIHLTDTLRHLKKQKAKDERPIPSTNELFELYCKTMRPADMNQGRDLQDPEARFILRVWDGMDGCWCDVCDGDASVVLSRWARETELGTQRTNFNHIDYYCIFPVGTRMMHDGQNPMFDQPDYEEDE